MQRDAKPKVVILRGDWLSKRDTQYYEPLTADYDLLGISVRRTIHDLSLVGFPAVAPWSVDSALANLGPVRTFLDRALRLRSENLMYFPSLDKLCEGASILDFAETFHPFCLQAVKIKAKRGLKLVCRVHENIPFAHENLAYRRRVKKLVFEHADAFITCSQLSKSSLVIEGAPEDKIHVIPMGLDVSQYTLVPKNPSLMAEIGISQSDFVVLFVARMVWEKGVHDVLNAMASLRSAAPDIKLLMVGDGPLAPKLPEWISRRGIEGTVKLVGKVPVPKMPDMYAMSDVVVVPSIATPTWQEQFGAVLIEAMACGKPLVATDSGAIPEVVGDAGIIVPQASYPDLAEAILRYRNDRELMAKTGEIGRRRAVELYSNEVVAAQIAALYRNLLGTEASQ